MIRRREILVRPMKVEDAVKRAEREWHDADYRQHARQEYPENSSDFIKRFERVDLTPFCEGGWSYWADPRAEAFGDLAVTPGTRVLDYGCGSGKLGMYLSLRGADVSGFDLSVEGVRVANEAAAHYGTAAKFEQMDAEDLHYPDNFFDLVAGFGVLHHVIKYPAAAVQLHRILRPGGRAIFHETLWDNPLINLARRFTTVDGDAGDAHLTESSIYEFCREFREIHLEKRNLIYMLKRFAKLPERDLSAPVRPRPFWRFIKSVDRKLLRFRPLQRYCGEVIVFLEK
jgi:2-polyprenyl-3-methyl-5-hydroxy-6-metoxy-1,4-benzoquinol methylase